MRLLGAHPTPGTPQEQGPHTDGAVRAPVLEEEWEIDN